MAYNNKHHQSSNNELRGLKVEVKNGDVNGALRLFKKKVQESNILQDLKDREFYEKPSITRSKAKKAARNRLRKEIAKNDLNSAPQHNKTKR